MYYAQIKECDIANGIGVRTTLFVSGCRHRCPGCFNEEAWPFTAGRPFAPEVEERLLKSLRPEYVDGLSVLGGEPLEPENQQALAPFLERVRAEFPKKSIWLWTGFTWEQLKSDESRARTESLDRVLANVDVLVDGPFVEAQKDLLLRFRGSSNQRMINVAASRERAELVLWEDERIYATHSW